MSSPKLEAERDAWATAIRKATDPIYGVLISHLYTEHLLDRYLTQRFPNSKTLLGKNGLSFSNKLKVVISLGEIDKQLADSLFKLNDIRNNCAHVFGHEISAQEVERYGRTLGKDHKRLRKTYPDAGTHGIAPITWNVVGQLLHFVSVAEGWE